MGTSVFSRLSPPCRFLPARPQINASRTQCALRRILLTSFVSTDSSLSCPRNPLLAATENRDERSARDRTDSKEPQKSLISMSALPEPHEGLNPALPPPALALTGGQTYQMQVPASTHLGQGQPLNMLFFLGSIPDYPPPSFDEAVAAAAAAARNAPPISPADSITTNSSFSDSYRAAPILIPPVPRSQTQPIVARSLPDPELRESLRYSTQADYDSDEDLELISTSEASSSTGVGSWEQDHRRAFPQRGPLEVGTAPTSARTLRSSPSQLTLTPHHSESPQDSVDDITASSPSTDSQGDDHTAEPHNFTPSSVPPRRRLHLLSGLLKSRDHPASAPSTPTHAAASQLSLPIHFLNRPGSPSKAHRGEGLISRKLFGNKGKDRNVEPHIGGPPEPLDTWDMLSDVERETPPVSSTSEYFPSSTSRQSESAIHLLSHGLRREGTRPRPKHLSMLNPPPAPQRSNTHMDPREPAVPRQPTVFAVHSPSSPNSQKQPARSSTQATATDSPTRGRSLRATASMIWNPVRRPSPPVASPTHSSTTPISPSSSASGDYDTPAVGNNEGVLLPPSLVQEEEEENFVTPPGSPARSPLTLLSSRHPSPVRHEAAARIGVGAGVTLRDDGPVPVAAAAPGGVRSSEPRAAAARTGTGTGGTPPTITPRPSINALQHAFAPPNPSPLSNQSFERQALMPPVVPPSPPLPRRDRDTVMSVGDTESLIDLYVHSAPAPARPIDSNERMAASENTGAGMHHHYPGRPLPHPPGASQSGPVRPVLLDAFLGGNGGNIPGGLPPYEEIELERQSQGQGQAGIWHFLPSFSQTKTKASAASTQQQQELFTVFDEDAQEQEQETEPSSPGSTYEMPPSTPPSSSPRECEFADMPDEEEDEELSTTMSVISNGSNGSARTIAAAAAAAALPTYCNCGSPERARVAREWATSEALQRVGEI